MAKAFLKTFQAKRPDGQIRQSQMVTTFGPGAMVDLVNRAIVVGGLEHWSYEKGQHFDLDDPRLRRTLLRTLRSLDPNLDLAESHYFRPAPACDWREASPRIGVRALEFPRWFVCQGCRRLARARDGFEDSAGRYRHQCAPNQKAQAVPVRFVAACPSGHLADFPWILFAHPGGVCERPELYLTEGATGDASRIIVRCANCSGSRALSQANEMQFPCRGDRPWLGGQAVNESCEHRIKLLVRTASDAYFAQIVSALRLPQPNPSALTLKLREKDVWKAVHKVTSIEQLQLLASLQDLVANAIAGESLEDVLAAIRAEQQAGDDQVDEELRTAEYLRFLGAPDENPGQLAPQGVQFAAFNIPARRADLPVGIDRLVLVPELREVRVQVSFSRFASISANLQGEYDFEQQAIKPAALTLATGNEKWLPAAEVRGEGVFFTLDSERLKTWENSAAVQERAEQLLRGFEADHHGAEFPGVRFYLLHSLAHLLLTAISLECGYAASSLRERIYCEPTSDGVKGMAGVLISTGTTGAEGTLGGLIEESRRLRHHLREAWDFGRLCSNDPVCAAHDPANPQSDKRLEGAACHGCLYVAESACERFNCYLDRALVVPTIGNHPDLAYFRDRP